MSNIRIAPSVSSNIFCFVTSDLKIMQLSKIAGQDCILPMSKRFIYAYAIDILYFAQSSSAHSKARGRGLDVLVS